MKTLDLHGCLEDEVFDRVDQFIFKWKSQPKLKIITGKGKGIVQKKLIEYLALSGYHWAFENLAGKKNLGVIIVFT